MCDTSRIMESTNNAMNDTERQSDHEQFVAIFPELLEDLTEMFRSHSELSEALHWAEQVNQYNVPSGRLLSSSLLFVLYKDLVDQSIRTEDDMRKVRIMGWCVQWLNGFWIVADDIVDKSTTRRGQACWYTKKGVGMAAVYDSVYLESAVYALLKKHFRTEPYYLTVVELFHQITLETVLGMTFEKKTAVPGEEIDFSKYTMERYMAIAKWKTGTIACLPSRLAVYMAGITDEQVHLNVGTIFIQIGIYAQLKNDYDDCYDDLEVIGKIGTDIEEGVCTWLIVKALEKGNEEQIKILKENYGHHDNEKVSRVKEVYQELDMPRLHKEYEKESYAALLALIDQYHGDLPKKMFFDCIEKNPLRYF